MLELLLGFTLLVVAVFALFALFPSSDKAVVRSVRLTQANEVARALMEAELNKNYSFLTDGEYTGQNTSTGLNRSGQTIEYVHDYKITISQPDPSRKYKDILVEVFWEEGEDKRKHGCKLQSSRGELI